MTGARLQDQPPADQCLGRLLALADRPEPPGSFRFGGYVIHAPGFDGERFAQAIDKALDAGLRVTAADRPGVFTVYNPAGTGSYVTTPDRCSCPAGRFVGRCKHRALVCLLTAIGPSEDRPRGP